MNVKTVFLLGLIYVSTGRKLSKALRPPSLPVTLKTGAMRDPISGHPPLSYHRPYAFLLSLFHLDHSSSPRVATQKPFKSMVIQSCLFITGKKEFKTTNKTEKVNLISSVYFKYKKHLVFLVLEILLRAIQNYVGIFGRRGLEKFRIVGFFSWGLGNS